MARTVMPFKLKEILIVGIETTAVNLKRYGQNSQAIFGAAAGMKRSNEPKVFLILVGIETLYTTLSKDMARIVMPFLGCCRQGLNKLKVILIVGIETTAKN